MRHVSVLYLDIDGTVRKGKEELGRFVNTAADVEVYAEVPELLAGYKALEWRIVGISNQGGIGLGYMSEQDCLEAMVETNRQCGFAMDKIIYCAHKPEDDCECRKPKSAMIVRARDYLFQQFGEVAPLFRSIFVGDMDVDRETAQRAGMPFLLAETWRTGTHLEGERLRWTMG
jgi:D-glycero-D-manno-heptose 1,7-bisphosphate phosphatase